MVADVLGQRDFRLLWIGETTSRLASNVTQVALPLVAVVTLHASTFTVGLLAAAGWLPWLLVGLPAGAWVDRLPRRPVLLACDAVSAVAYVSVPVVAWLHLLTMAQLVAVALVAGTAGVFFGTAYRVYLPGLLAPADLAAGNAVLQGSESAAQLAGRSLGGVLAQWLGAVTGLLADAVSFVVSAGCLLAIRMREPARSPRPPTRLRQEIGEGLRWVVGDRYLRALGAFAAVANFGLTGYQALQVLFGVRVLHAPPALVGVVVAASGVGGMLGALVVSRLVRRVGTARGLVVLILVTWPFGMLIPLAFPGPGLVLLALGNAVLAAGAVATNVVAAGFRQTYPPERLRGRVMATSTVIATVADPIGAVVAGAVGTALGVRATVWIMIGVVLAAGVIVLAGPVRRGRDLPTAARAAANTAGGGP
jgi:predicted MFS family arabinose efflux permease